MRNGGFQCRLWLLFLPAVALLAGVGRGAQDTHHRLWGRLCSPAATFTAACSRRPFPVSGSQVLPLSTGSGAGLGLPSPPAQSHHGAEQCVTCHSGTRPTCKTHRASYFSLSSNQAPTEPSWQGRPQDVCRREIMPPGNVNC